VVRETSCGKRLRQMGGERGRHGRQAGWLAGLGWSVERGSEGESVCVERRRAREREERESAAAVAWVALSCSSYSCLALLLPASLPALACCYLLLTQVQSGAQTAQNTCFGPRKSQGLSALPLIQIWLRRTSSTVCPPHLSHCEPLSQQKTVRQPFAIW
jgi:hypothetical protein